MRTLPATLRAGRELGCAGVLGSSSFESELDVDVLRSPEATRITYELAKREVLASPCIRYPETKTIEVCSLGKNERGKRARGMHAFR